MGLARPLKTQGFAPILEVFPGHGLQKLPQGSSLDHVAGPEDMVEQVFFACLLCVTAEAQPEGGCEIPIIRVESLLIENANHLSGELEIKLQSMLGKKRGLKE